MNDDLQRAWELLRLCRPKEAAAAATRHLAVEPESAKAHIALAFAQSQLDADDAAVASAETAVRLDPESAHGHYVLALMQAANGHSKAAWASLERCLESDPEEADAHGLHATLLLERGDRTGALAAIDRALSLDPDDADHHATRASILLATGGREQAAASVAHGLRLAPEHEDLHRLQGELHLGAGHVEAATQAYLTVLRLDPTDEKARKGLLEALRGRNRVYRGILLLRQGVLSLIRQHRVLPTVLVVVACAAGVRLLGGTTGYTWVKGTLVAVFLVPAEIANLFLLLHPVGRHALTRTEKVVAAGVGTALLLAGLLSGLAALMTSKTLLEVAQGSAGMVLVFAFWHWILGDIRLGRAAKRRIAILVLVGIVVVIILWATLR